MELSNSDLEFFRRFSKAPEGRFLLEWLRGNLAAADAKLRVASGDDLLRKQGRAQFLAELIDTISKAEERATQAKQRGRAVALWPPAP